MSSLTRKRQAEQPKKNRGSAGNARATTCGTVRPLVENLSMEQFRRACDRMLAEHVPGYQVFNFAGKDVTRELLANAPVKVREERRVTRVVWRSKQMRECRG